MPLHGPQSAVGWLTLAAVRTRLLAGDVPVHHRQLRRAPGNGAVVVLAHQRRDGRGDLGLGRLDALSHALGRGARPYDRGPNELGAFDFLAVVGPVELRVAAAVVGGHDQRRVAGVTGRRLER